MAANTAADFRQILLSNHDVSLLMPDWPPQLVEDYLSFKRDLALSASAGDGVADRTTENEADIINNAAAIAQNVIDIDANAADILWLERRVLGDTRPAAYDEAAGYVAGDLVVDPSTDPQTYYYARDTIVAPAGTFDINEWRVLNLIGVLEEINRIALVSVDNFVLAGYGSISASAPVAIGNIDATFQTITGLDTADVAAHRVTYDFPNNGISVDAEGVWQLNVNVVVEFDELNAGRQIQLQIYNDTAAIVGKTLTYFIGRNVGGINMSFSSLTEVSPAEVGDLVVVQVGSLAATYTTSVVVEATYSFTHVSELVGAL